MKMRYLLSAILMLFVASGVLVSTRSAQAATEPALYVYDCFHNDFAECRDRFTPPFESCSGWAGWVIPRLDPNFAYNFSEGPFFGQYGEVGKQCGITRVVGGGLVTRSIAFAFCQTPDESPSGPDPREQVCVGTGPKPTMECGESCPNVGDPINPAPSVGNKYEVSLDYVGTGPFPLRLERYYNSAGTRFYPGDRL